jgi:midasin (ATPase involved in ribosome maturation)
LEAHLKQSLPSIPADSDLVLRTQKILQNLVRLKSAFEWHDGPLVEAMRNGDVLLLDEISLADDSVLERLNSVLEPSRSLVLAEKGGEDLVNPTIYAQEGFQVIATMNPGGDYGKKELSPALRNRFTEIWVPAVDDRADLLLIVSRMWIDVALHPFSEPLLDFVDWLCHTVGDRTLMNLRDILVGAMDTILAPTDSA